MRATPPTACAVRAPAAPGPTADARAQPGSYASTVLGPDRRSAGQARRLTRTTLTRWGLPHLADDAETIASELAANAVAHAVDPQGARPAIIFAIHYRLSALQITIWDNGPGQPVRADPGPDAVTGRGLTIIDALTDSNWGWWPTPRSGGKVVHATLAASGPGDSLTLSTHQEEP
jgi:anti-sigma regulatory factor (Ser/Thr protein kinase)